MFFSLSILLSLLVCSSIHAETVALWLFDDPVGATTAYDYSGNGYHLSLGPDAAIVSNGRYGNCLDADALPDDGLGAFRYHAEPALNPGDHDWTLECWLKAKTDMRMDNRIWGLSGVNYIDYGHGDNLQTLRVVSRFLPLDGPKGFSLPTGELTADHEFHHLAVVYESSRRELRHYFDGKLQCRVEGTWRNVPSDDSSDGRAQFPPFYPVLQIGMRDAIQQWDHRELNQERGVMKKLQGYMDEIRFSDQALYQSDFPPPSSFALPSLRVWPQEVSLQCEFGKTRPVKALLSISSPTLGGPWEIDEEIPWLEVSPTSGETSGSESSVQLKVTIPDIPIGFHKGILKVHLVSGIAEVTEVHLYLANIDPNQVLDVADRKQLLFDDRFIEKKVNCIHHLNEPEKLSIDFEPMNEAPLYPGGIIYDTDRSIYRMFYSAFNGTRTNYVISTDGIHWRKPPDNYPPFGIEPKEGDPNTLLPFPFQTSFLLDLHAPEMERFKAVAERRDEAHPEKSGVYVYVSQDGFRFHEAAKVLNFLPEGGAYPLWDERLGKYVVYMRVQNIKQPLKMIQGNQFLYRPGFTYEKPDSFVDRVEPEAMYQEGLENLRSIGRIETQNLLKPWPVKPTASMSNYATAMEIEPVLVADQKDGFADFYTAPVLQYPLAQDSYFAFPSVFRHFHPSRQPWFYKFADANGPIEIQLATSRDGIHWDRSFRSAYVPMGLTSEWDRWLNMIGHGMIHQGDSILMYYWGSSRLHDSLYLRPELADKQVIKGPHALGILRQRLDGFISIDADHRGGEFTTPPLVFHGNRLFINHNCGASGTLFVEIQDVNGLPFHGFSLADCEEVTGNDVDWEIRWRGSGDIKKFQGKLIRLHFCMAGTKIYAFQFRETLG